MLIAGFIIITFVAFGIGWGCGEMECDRNNRENFKPSHNSQRDEILLNCSTCHWRDHCVLTFNGDVCRLKYERKTSPV